jgi:hypothetical protein
MRNIISLITIIGSGERAQGGSGKKSLTYKRSHCCLYRKDAETCIQNTFQNKRATPVGVARLLITEDFQNKKRVI